MGPDFFVRAQAQLAAEFAIFHQPDDPLRSFLDAADQEAIHAVVDLIADAADTAADDGGAFPHRFADRESEALANGFL